MLAARVSELRNFKFRMLVPRRLFRFLSVGLASTLLYAGLAAWFAALESKLLSASLASILAYAVAALFSYFAHKFFTFTSRGSVSFEAPRFIVLTMFGFGVAYVLPALLTGGLGMPVLVPILLTCVIIPAVNYIILDRCVFFDRSRQAGRLP